MRISRSSLRRFSMDEKVALIPALSLSRARYIVRVKRLSIRICSLVKAVPLIHTALSTQA